MPGSITNTSCDIDLRLKCCFVTLAALHHIQTVDTNRELFLEHECIRLNFFSSSTAATLVHICLHLVLFECAATVHTCISNVIKRRTPQSQTE